MHGGAHCFPGPAAASASRGSGGRDSQHGAAAAVPATAQVSVRGQIGVAPPWQAACLPRPARRPSAHVGVRACFLRWQGQRARGAHSGNQQAVGVCQAHPSARRHQPGAGDYAALQRRPQACCPSIQPCRLPGRPLLQLLPRIKEIGGDANQLVRSALATVVMELAPILGKVRLACPANTVH